MTVTGTIQTYTTTIAITTIPGIMIPGIMIPGSMPTITTIPGIIPIITRVHITELPTIAIVPTVI